MQRTIRILRIALPIAFFAFIAVLVISWRRAHIKPPKPPSEPVAGTLTGQKPMGYFHGFEDTQTIGGRVVMHIRAARVVAYTGDWNTLEDVELTIYRPTGLTYQLTCPSAKFNSKTKVADAQGGVRVTSNDNVDIRTAEIHYDGNRLTNHIPVQFRVDQWNGNAGALDLDVEGETLHLFEKLDATMTPAQPADAPMTIAAADGVFRRRENDATFTKDVVMTRGADRMTADHMVGHLTQDRKKLVSLEGNGKVVIVASGNPAPGEDLGGRKEITCERFATEPGPDGQIKVINAFGGQGMAHAVFDGPPKRDVVAKNFRVELAGRAVHDVKADSQVVMKELADVAREVSGDRVTLNFDPAQHKAVAAYVEGSFRYKDPKNSASAINANYDIANDRILLTAEPGFDPTVVTDGNVLKAKQIEFSPKGGTAKATGSVIAQLTSKQSGVAADSTNLFPAGKPVFVNADVLTMRQANKLAVFAGNVRAWQETNTLFSQELQVQGMGDTITARGNVRTQMYNTGGEARKTPMQTTSDQLVARRNDRRVELLGSVRMQDEQRTVTADHATLFMDAARKFDHMEAENHVVMTDASTGRKATGDRAIYNIKTKIVLVDGSPATATAPTGNLSGEHIRVDLARNKVEIVGATAPPQGTYKPQP